MTPGQLDYGDSAGCLELRQAIADHLQAARGTTCIADQVVVVAGAQRGLQMIGAMLLDPGDRVWLEDPGYPGARSALAQAGARIVPVRVDDQGLDVAAATRQSPHARLAYVTPSNQFPLGVPMSLMRRLALLKWAAGAGAWIVEDDYDSEFRYSTRPLPCLHGLDADGRVIYVGTFAKSMFPAMRLGFVVVPVDLVPHVQAMRRAADLHPPVLEQMALADFIRGGHYATHLRRMRSVYRERLEALESAAAEFCGGALRLRPIQGGLHAVADLDEADDERVGEEARRRGIEAAPLRHLLPDAPYRQRSAAGVRVHTAEDTAPGHGTTGRGDRRRSTSTPRTRPARRRRPGVTRAPDSGAYAVRMRGESRRFTARCRRGSGPGCAPIADI